MMASIDPNRALITVSYGEDRLFGGGRMAG